MPHPDVPSSVEGRRHRKRTFGSKCRAHLRGVCQTSSRRPRGDRRRSFYRMQIAAAHEEIGCAVVHLRIREVHFGQILPVSHTRWAHDGGWKARRRGLLSRLGREERASRWGSSGCQNSARLQDAIFRVNGPMSGFAVAASLPRSGAAESLRRRPVSRR
jgi:hypothetical protein